MQRAKVGGAAFVLIGALAGATPGHAQATFGVDLDLFSSYVWRGLTLTNKPVAEPGVMGQLPGRQRVDHRRRMGQYRSWQVRRSQR